MSECVEVIKAEVARFTLLDHCGVPVTGEGSAQVTTDSWTEIGISPQYEDGTEFIQKKANGRLCVNELDPGELKRIEETTTMCSVDVDLIAMLTGQDVVANGDDFVGVIFGEGLLNAQFSKEVWQPVVGEGECDPEGNQRWMYWAFPREFDARIQDFTFQNDIFNLSFMSKSKRASPLWDIGDPWLADNPTATWGPGKHFAFAVTTTPPPEAACGAQEIGS